jgi:hypothetical protein
MLRKHGSSARRSGSIWRSACERAWRSTATWPRSTSLALVARPRRYEAVAVAQRAIDSIDEQRRLSGLGPREVLDHMGRPRQHESAIRRARTTGSPTTTSGFFYARGAFPRRWPPSAA